MGIQSFLVAWDWLKRRVNQFLALERAVATLPPIEIMPDWTIACLEYMNRYAQNRRIQPQFFELVAKKYPNLTEPTMNYIIHDKGMGSIDA
jgi:hypothetical protein